MDESFPKFGASYDDIDKWARAASADIENRFYEDEQPLPAYLYHITTRENAKKFWKTD